jgi:hypothetical protein
MFPRPLLSVLTIPNPLQTLVAYENLKKHLPYPDPNQSISLTELVMPKEEDLARVRARNALKGESVPLRNSLSSLC